MLMDGTNLFCKSKRYHQSTREDMVEFIPTGVKKTLEFGCGEGGFSALLKDRLNAETWAVEINEESARQAAKKLHKVINDDAFMSLKNYQINILIALFALIFWSTWWILIRCLTY